MNEDNLDESFVRSPLVEIDFEVRFPHLFYISQAIGEFQLEIMDDFPKSSQILEQSLVITEKGEVEKNVEKMIPSWQFENDVTKIIINVRSNRFTISSREYTSYNKSDKKFRDVINKTLSSFIRKIPIKKFSRIGLRYINQCPLERLENEYFKKFYVPVFDIDKYKIEDIIDSYIKIRRKGEYGLLFQCGVRKIDKDYKYYLDYDGYANDVEEKNFLDITDNIHILIKKEFYSNITEEFKQYMRGVDK